MLTKFPKFELPKLIELSFGYNCLSLWLNNKEVVMKFSISNLWSVIQMFIVIAMLSLVSLSVRGQDLIVTQTGETIKAYRTDVGEKMIYYQLEDVEESPVMKIKKVDVLVIKLQSGEVISFHEKSLQPLDAEHPVANAIMPPSEPVADPEMIAHAEIGSLIEFYDGTKGVVFYLNGEGHGLAVSLYQQSNNWQNTSLWYDCVDITAIPNEKNTIIQMGLGASYCNAAIKQLRLKDLPAIQWSRSLGPDWYLPSLGELNELLIVSNRSKGTEGPISHVLKANGGDPIQDTFFYYSSSEDDNTNIYSIIGSGGITIVKKYYPYPCVAIRMF